MSVVSIQYLSGVNVLTMKRVHTITTPTPQFNGQSDPQYTNQEQAYAQQGQPYGQPTFAPSGPAGYQQKSKIIAGILGIFLGGFGIHNFYLGRTTRAVIQLVLTIFTFGVASLWGFIEGILILVSAPGSEWHRDGNGIELTD